MLDVIKNEKLKKEQALTDKWAEDMRAKIAAWLRKDCEETEFIYRFPRWREADENRDCADAAISLAVQPFSDNETKIMGIRCDCVYFWYDKDNGRPGVKFMMKPQLKLKRIVTYDGTTITVMV